MKCRDARELLNSYFDNGLDPEQDKPLMEHVDKCHKCSEELRFLAEYRKTVAGIRPVKAPDNFMSELQKRLEAEESGTIRKFFHDAVSAWKNFTFPLEAAGVIAVALLIFFLYTPLFHGVKRMATYNEEQSVTEPKADQAAERRKLLPQMPGKKERRDTGAIEGDLKVSDEDRVITKTEGASEEERPAGSADDSLSVMDKESSDDSFYDTGKDKAAAGVFRSESAEKNEAPREMRKKAVSADEISRPSSITPERLISESGGIIVKKSNGKYTVKIRKDKLPLLAEKLRRNFSATYKIAERDGSTLTVEFRIRE